MLQYGHEGVQLQLVKEAPVVLRGVGRRTGKVRKAECEVLREGQGVQLQPRCGGEVGGNTGESSGCMSETQVPIHGAGGSARAGICLMQVWTSVNAQFTHFPHNMIHILPHRYSIAYAWYMSWSFFAINAFLLHLLGECGQDFLVFEWGSGGGQAPAMEPFCHQRLPAPPLRWVWAQGSVRLWIKPPTCHVAATNKVRHNNSFLLHLLGDSKCGGQRGIGLCLP